MDFLHRGSLVRRQYGGRGLTVARVAGLSFFRNSPLSFNQRRKAFIDNVPVTLKNLRSISFLVIIELKS